MSETAEAVIGFIDRKENGHYPVLDANGATIALIKVPWTGGRFVATDPSGALLCRGDAPIMLRTFQVKDAAGGVLLSLRSGFWNGKRRTVTLADGRELTMQGASWPRRDWSVVDPAGWTVLGIATTTSGWSFDPDAYVVKVADPQLTLAHVIGIVQANRLLVKASRAAAAS